MESKPKCTCLPKFVVKSDARLRAQLDQHLADAKIDDLATIIYTSGTTGDPKGVMLDQGSLKHLFKIHEMRLKVDSTDRSLSFLPLSHIFERGWAYFMMYSGAHNYFLQNPRTVIDVLPRVKPTLMCAVPRFFEKTYQGIQDETSRWPAIKRVFFKRAMAVGEERLKYVTANKPIPAVLRLQLAFYHKLVYSKLRRVLGGEIRFMPCAGAAASTELLTFFHSAGINIKYGYGATETTASVSCFKDYGFDLVSVGEIMPEVDVKISPEGEIMVKGNTVFRGYYKKPVETAAVLRDGWYYTGDAGSVKAGGHLVMSERMRDIMKTSVGKYVSPQRIELLLGQDPLIEQIVTIGDDRRFVMGLIVPVYDRIDALARELRLREQPREDMLKDPKLIQHLNERFISLQTSLQPHERMVKFTLLPEPFSIEKGELTSTLKLRRKEISRIYKDLIEEVYSS
ncbi:MAG: long-chain fatty acid--CoA ligase [Bacteroidetes bacterium HGW-Bacteroidetes-22]|nr:MAG: long-chain fatty acid--CoA ligase [Bacteroidetes bacterium HGW-Bacteroidetes-22]